MANEENSVPPVDVKDTLPGTPARLCGALAAALGALALVGWSGDLHILSTFGAKQVPMAPSTAVFFLLQGLLLALLPLLRRSSSRFRFARAIAVIVPALAALLFCLSLQNRYFGIERLGFPGGTTPGGIPLGHMSPLTAFCFLLTGAAVLPLVFTPFRRPRHVAATLLFSFASLWVGVLLVTAYLLGGPLLYDSGVIPPALPTSFAFLALSVGLLLSTTRRIWVRSDPEDTEVAGSMQALVLLFALLTAGMVTGGYLSYRSFQTRYLAKTGNELVAVAKLKVSELLQWRRERLSDATVFHDNPNFAALAHAVFGEPENTEARRKMRIWLEKVRSAYSYERLSLFDVDGNEFQFDAPPSETRVPIPSEAVLEAIQEKRVRFVDFYRASPEAPVRLAVLAPLFAPESHAPIGVLAFQIDPQTQFYPLLERWPTPSDTAETLLVRRDGDSVLFLNDLRFHPGAALKLRIPLARTELPAAMAILGERGEVEGVDYREARVLAAVQPIPDSPWFLVARVDAAEVHAPLRERLWVMIGILAFLLLGAGAGMYGLWAGQKNRFFRARYRAAEALRRSEETLRLIFENTRDGILAADTKTQQFVTCNEAVCEMLGYTREELLRLGVPDIHPPEKLPDVQKQLDRQIRGEISLAADLPVRRKDGSVFPADINATPVTLNGVECIVGVFRDITERKRAEEKLRYQQALLEEMGRIAKIGAWEFDPTTGKGTWTAEVARIHDLDPDEETDMERGLNFYRGESREKIEEAIRNAAETGEPYDLELEMVSARGAHRWVRTIASPKVEDGKVVCVRGSFQDITAEKRAEARIAHLNAVLSGIRNVNQLITHEKNREKLIREACELLVEARGFYSVCIGLVDETDGSLGLHTGTGEKPCALGETFARGEIPDCARQALKGMDLAVRHCDDPECEGCPAADTPEEHDSVALSLAHEDRSYGFMLCTLPSGMANDPEEQELLREVTGDIAYALHGIEMEEQRETLEEQLRQAQKMEAIGRLAGGVAHDFNNMLSIIIGYCELMENRAEDKEHTHKEVAQIKDSALRAAALTGQLLAFGRKQILEPKVLDLNEVVTGLEEMLRRLIGEDIDLSVAPAEALDCIKADSGQIEQILMNLAVNARDAMPKGGRLTIETENVVLDEDYVATHPEVEPGPHVMLAVSDTGEGMDRETRERLFEPFFTTKAKGKGTGLGLSTVYGIVKQSGGSIWVYSEPGGGTTFKVYFPRVEEAPEKTEKPKTGTSRIAQGETILAVEDETGLRDLLVQMLESGGYKVLAADSGAEALEICREHCDEIGLVITDVVMPNMSGRELAEALKDVCPDVKVLYTSGYTDNAIVHHGVLDPDTPFLQKPYTISVLLEKVREVMDA